MPEPIIFNNQCYVDFAGELKLKSLFQLELYVDGYNKILKTFLSKSEPYGEQLKPGVLLVDKKRYFEVEQSIKHKFQNVEESMMLMKDIYKHLKQFKVSTENFEAKLDQHMVISVDFETYYKELTDLMSLFCIQWLSFNVSTIQTIASVKPEELSIFFSPHFYEPYQIRFDDAYYECLKEPSEKKLNGFIKEFAFLDNFEIYKNTYENISSLIKKIDEDSGQINVLEKKRESFKKRQQQAKIKRQLLSEKILANNHEYFDVLYNNILLMRCAADEEEERHYLQSRAIRNVRRLLEQHDMNIHSSYNDILKKLKS